MPIVVDVGKQMTGATFLLDPRTVKMLASLIPGWSPPCDRVFLGFDKYWEKPWDWDRIQDPMWTQIVMFLTGLNEKQVHDLGGFVFIVPSHKQKEVVFESRAA
jgi:hypothetical protein